MPSNSIHPKFLWGVGTSSYQSEGGITNNDWNYFTTSDSIRKRISGLTTPTIFYKDIRHLQLQPAANAVRFWENKYYERDFENAKNMGLNSFRISLEWARIEPERNQWDQEVLDNYRRMLLSMREKGLEPIVTLNHLTLPLWVLTPPLQFKKKFYQHFFPHPLRDLPIRDPPSSDPYWKSLRGWENEETVREFIHFVGKVVSEFKDLVDYWITINEPVASIIGGGYLAGISPPGFILDGRRTKAVLHNLIQAHVQAFEIQGIKTGIEVVGANSVLKGIIDYANESRVDVIVIGTKGLTGVEKFLIGSVASAVIDHAHCPVFAIR